MQMYQPRVTFLVATGGVPLASAEAIRNAIHAVDPAIAVGRVETLRSLFDAQISRYRVTARLVGALGALALLLAMVGLYGILSYLVTQRTREIGIEVALGATRQRVTRNVLARGLRLTLVGIVLGTAAAAFATRLVSSSLFGISPLDPLTFVAVPLLLVAVAAASSLLPVRRAAAVDPLIALKSD